MTKKRKQIGGRKGGTAYSETVHKAVKGWKLDNDIINSIERMPNLSKEIQRVFHAANRRIQNVENAGVFSPAVAAVSAYLEENQNDLAAFNSFAKFSTAGKSWTEIKNDYAAAIEFLQKPTSTASGARTLEKQIKSELAKQGVNENAFEYIKNDLLNGGGKFSEKSGNIAALVPSDATKIIDVFKTATHDLADEIENAAKQGNADELERAAMTDLKNILGGLMSFK